MDLKVKQCDECGKQFSINNDSEDLASYNLHINEHTLVLIKKMSLRVIKIMEHLKLDW